MKIPRWLWLAVAVLLVGVAVFMVVGGGGEPSDEAGDGADGTGTALRRPGSGSRTSASRPRQRQLDPAEALRRFERDLVEWQSHVKGSVLPDNLPDGLEQRMKASIRGLAVDDLRRLYREWSTDVRTVAANQHLLQQVIEAWGKVAPEEAWAAVEKRFARGRIDRHSADMMVAALKGWSQRDPEAASEAYLAHIGGETVGGAGSQPYRERLGKTVFENLAARNPDAAWAALARLPAAASYAEAAQGYYAGLPNGWDWRMEAERFSTIPAFVNLSAGLSGDGGQAAGSHPSRDWQYHTDGAQALAQRWAAADPAEALNWFVKTTPYLTGGRKVQPSQCQQLRVKRASDLLTPLYREQPQAAVNWLRDQPWEWERSDVIPLTVVRAVATRQAASDLLPLMAEERYRFGFVLERARILEQERSGRARKPDSEPWTVEDIRSILPAANLTPEHQKQVDAMLARAAR